MRAIVLVVIALGGMAFWSTWTVKERGDKVAALAGQTVGLDAVQQTRQDVLSEVAGLLALKVLPGDTAQLRSLTSTTTVGPDPLRFARQADRSGALGLTRLNQADFGVGEKLIVVLRPLGDADLQAMGLGEPITVNATQYVEALGELDRLGATATERAQAAARSLSELAQQWEPWADPRWWLVMVGLSALCLVSLIDLRRSVHHGEQQRKSLTADKDRLSDLLSVTKVLSSADDVGELCHKLAEESCRLANAEFAVVYLKDQAICRPYGLSGNIAPAVVRPGEGVVALVQSTGEMINRTVLSDAAFPKLVGQASVVAVPMEENGQRFGVLVAGIWGTSPMPADSQAALSLLGLTVGRNFHAVTRNQRTGALVNTDSLTGLYNRRKLDGDLSGRVPSLVSEGRNVAFAMVDVDHFKKFNDAYGHPAGDALLRQVARAIAHAVRAEDIVYRYGGEEFCVLLPGASPEEARLVCERIRWSVEHTPVLDERGGLISSVTVSVGIVCHSDGNVQTLVASADSALYLAKQQGRNRVVEAA
jgi:diguanylate cyclase (GGDEF)-like protein